MIFYFIMYFWGFGKGGWLFFVGVFYYNILFVCLRIYLWVIFGLSLFISIVINILINV